MSWIIRLIHPIGDPLEETIGPFDEPDEALRFMFEHFSDRTAHTIEQGDDADYAPQEIIDYLSKRD